MTAPRKDPEVYFVIIPSNTNGRKIPCPYCDEVFELFYEFGDHASQKHSETVDGKKVYRCPPQHCSKLFSRLKEIVDHMHKVSELANMKKKITEQLEQDKHNTTVVNTAAESSSTAPGLETDQRKHYTCFQCRFVFFDWNTFFDHCYETHGFRNGLDLADSEGYLQHTFYST